MDFSLVERHSYVMDSYVMDSHVMDSYYVMDSYSSSTTQRPVDDGGA